MTRWRLRWLLRHAPRACPAKGRPAPLVCPMAPADDLAMNTSAVASQFHHIHNLSPSLRRSVVVVPRCRPYRYHHLRPGRRYYLCSTWVGRPVVPTRRLLRLRFPQRPSLIIVCLRSDEDAEPKACPAAGADPKVCPAGWIARWRVRCPPLSSVSLSSSLAWPSLLF